MSNPKFAETHNLIAFLEKSEESDGFEEIIDFLNASSIKYALMVNPTIYTSCIKQFWITAKAKTVNEERQIQALIDKKKVIITEMSVRRNLKLKDAEGTDCLPTTTIFEELTLNKKKVIITEMSVRRNLKLKDVEGTDCLPTTTIFKELTRIGAKTTAWNEFSSTMASAIICLATNQNFNFSKYIFDNMIKNLKGGVRFLMYPRFVQVFLDKQVGDMSSHDDIYIITSHTKKVFANMMRQGKGFSRYVTPLFHSMMVQASEDMGEYSAAPTNSHPTPIITQLSSSRPQKK
ncbi:hypothetical protein Tco_0348662 [Tanacetum coccineum]